MISGFPFSLIDVLAVARVHPFYVPSVKYPPDADAIYQARRTAHERQHVLNWNAQPFLWKSTLYTTINRLLDDANPQNTFRHNVYISATGGGTGAKPLLFTTDANENRQARAIFAQFLRNMGLVKKGDWVVTTHTAGELYRSLDLTLEILENAGASVLAAGQHMSPADVVQLIINYHANVLSGDSSQIISIVHYMSTLSKEDRENIKLNKIIYTSEGLTPSQRRHILETLGNIQICSILGSAEAGPYAVSCPHVTANGFLISSYEDFVFDTRLTEIEILPFSFSDKNSVAELVEEGQTGIIAQTSLTRLRNPLVRYITGDVGSLHPLPEAARPFIDGKDWEYLRVLRLQGRDHRFSFEWDGNYLEFNKLDALLNNAQSKVLQWQVLLDKMEPSMEGSLEVRILCSNTNADSASVQSLVDQIELFFHVYSRNSYRFKLVFLKDLGGFKVSETGRKVIKFINNFN